MSWIAPFVGQVAVQAGVGYSSARFFGLMDPHKAVIGTAIYSLMTTSINSRGETVLDKVYDQTQGLLGNNINFKKVKFLTPISSRAIACFIAYKAQDLNSKDILMLVTISEIALGFFDLLKNGDFSSEGIKKIIEIGVSCGVSYLLADRFSILNPTDVAKQTLLYSLVRLILFKEICEDLEGRGNSFSRGLFYHIKKYDTSVPHFIYFAQAYCRGTSPTTIMTLLGTSIVSRKFTANSREVFFG
jgi:hypothetical protein